MGIGGNMFKLGVLFILTIFKALGPLVKELRPSHQIQNSTNLEKNHWHWLRGRRANPTNTSEEVCVKVVTRGVYGAHRNV